MTPPAAAARILVVDDEPDQRMLYELALLREGYQVETADDVASGLQALRRQRFDMLITDMSLPDGMGLSLLEAASAPGRKERSLVITAHGSAENAVTALKAGAFDYLTKPIDLRQLRQTVASALHRKATRLHAVGATAGTRPPHGDAAALQRLAGFSTAMQDVRTRILRAARVMAPVLILGESGTGKELAARAVHACGHRADGPFVAVNCSAIPENLLEAEFFGSLKGAFTGATQDRPGFFQAAHGGTLFLDEIGELPPPMQAKLRAIQERQVRAIGSSREAAVDVRIVSATHRDLAAEVTSGGFRSDLFYRLNVIDIMLPPLRERREDIPVLCDALLARIARDSGQPVPPMTSELLACLMHHPLPGNVRELENLLQRAIALGDGQQLSCAPEYTSQPATAPATRQQPSLRPHAGGIPRNLPAHLDAYEADIIRRALEANHYNRTATAAVLGLSLRQIRYRIARLNIGMPRHDAEALPRQQPQRTPSHAGPGDDLLRPAPRPPTHG